MMKRSALIVLGVGSPLILVAFVIGGTLGGGLFVGIALLFPVAICALGARTGQSNAGLWRILVGLVALLELAALAVLFLSPEVVAGLPRSTWAMLLGFGLFPLLLVSVGYAVTFSPPRSPEG
jgi:hypothetical protein